MYVAFAGVMTDSGPPARGGEAVVSTAAAGPLSSDPAVNPLLLVEDLVTGLVGGKPEGLLAAQAQEPGRDQAVVQQAVDAGRQVVVEIDQDVAAQDDLEL